MKTLKVLSLITIFGLLAVSHSAFADLPTTRDDGVTVIHLDEYSGYFSAEETLASLKAGEYEFVITNRSDKLVGWQLQNNTTREHLDGFPLEPGETRVSRVTVTTDGVRFRCPINPTPWYELDTIK